MLPKWFNTWNRDNPTNIFGPAIVVGAVGGAVFVAAMLVGFGQPYATDSLQTGPRGTGMSVAKFVSEAAMPDPTIEDYYTEAPYEREEGEPLASEIYENVQVLGGVSEGNFNRLMLAMTQWVSPEEGCVYCHAGAEEGNYADDDLYTKVVARSMIQMTQSINENWIGHVQANQEVGVNCYTCHRGEHVPSEVWYRIDPVNNPDAAQGWAAVQNRATTQSQFTSLPSDALYQYLINYETIAVHDLESRVSGSIPEGDIASIQDTERTYSFMNYFANSLGVNCVFCHNSRAFYSAQGEVTPQWSTASLGISMAQEINNDWIVPLTEILPEKRLGPIYADAPKAACKTCHKGYQKPMGGLNVIADWPELASSEAPTYE